MKLKANITNLFMHSNTGSTMQIAILKQNRAKLGHAPFTTEQRWKFSSCQFYVTMAFVIFYAFRRFFTLPCHILTIFLLGLPEPEEMVAKRFPSDGLLSVLTRKLMGVLRPLRLLAYTRASYLTPDSKCLMSNLGLLRVTFLTRISSVDLLR